MEVSRYLDLFVDIGQAMLEAGAGIHRVEDTIYRLCGAYGLGRADIFAIRSLILVTIREDTGKSYTDSRRIYGIGTNMARLGRTERPVPLYLPGTAGGRGDRQEIEGIHGT